MAKHDHRRSTDMNEHNPDQSTADIVLPLPSNRGPLPEPERNVRLLLSVEQAAQRLQIGRSTVYTLVAQNQLESVKIGKLRRIPAAALDDYVDALRHMNAMGA
jgi:excisionase family DNA binding protein